MVSIAVGIILDCAIIYLRTFPPRRLSIPPAIRKPTDDSHPPCAHLWLRHMSPSADLRTLRCTIGGARPRDISYAWRGAL